MRYFTFEIDSNEAVKKWEQSQYDLSDIVLALTDRKIFYGAKIYAIFCRKEVLNLMEYFVCDFKKIKRDLGILGDYVERSGNVFEHTYNPKRNNKSITLELEEMNQRAKSVYKHLMFDLETIATTLNN